VQKALDAIGPDDCNPQASSPLFKLPGELRNMIYVMAMSGDKSESNFITGQTNQSRALLRSCRRVWTEARGLVTDKSTLSIPRARNKEEVIQRLEKMREEDFSGIGHLLLMEIPANTPYPLQCLRPKHMTVRIRLEHYQDFAKHILAQDVFNYFSSLLTFSFLKLQLTVW
jgi:hypothetical protein